MTVTCFWGGPIRAEALPTRVFLLSRNLQTECSVTPAFRHSEAFRDNAWLLKLTNVGAAPGFFLMRPKAAPGSRAKRDKAS